MKRLNLCISFLSRPDAMYASGNTSDAPVLLGNDVMSGDLSTCPVEVDLLIVGAGLSGAVLAERCNKEPGMTSIVIDKRSHIGGNCISRRHTMQKVRCTLISHQVPQSGRT